MKRLFVAIKVEPSQTLLETYERFRKWFSKEQITWADAGNFHITLRFIGDTPEQDIPAIQTALQKVAVHYQGFTSEIKGVGVFGSTYKPRVLWFGVEDSSGTLLPMSKDISGVLEELGIEDDRQNFVPHLTMGRIKFLRFKKKLEEKVNKFKDTDFHSFPVNAFYLFESRLGPEGPTYHVIESYSLKKGGAKAMEGSSSKLWQRLLGLFRP